MPSDKNAARVSELLAETTRLQAQAADPTASVWVSANAGTGKTHVLTQRVLRLLLTGTPPERILCLTYTKAAAAEMSKRVFDTLAGWVGLTDHDLTTALTKLLGTPPSTKERDLSRTLFARAIETPGGFKVQTIHAFCERLLQRFPLEAGVAPGFKILDDQLARTLITEAINDTLVEATSDRTSALGRALTTTIRYAADDQFDTVLTDAIKQRALLDGLQRRPDRDIDPFDFASELLRNTFSVRQFAQADGIRSELEHILDVPTIKRLIAALSDGTANDTKAATKLSLAAATSGPQRVNALASFFLTKTHTPAKSLMTKAIREAHPDLEMKVGHAQNRFVELDRELTGLDVVEATLALYRLADAVLTRYQSAKAARAALDFEDLIVKSARLLGDGAGAAWVLFKLDGGLDHILVDEAQDTAPSQWQVVQRIAEEFFQDAGAGAKTGTRTVFAVGDEKQSIYSFQGAKPELFAKAGGEFKQHAAGIGMTWHQTALTLSFRTVAPILTAVDRVFADPLITPGLSTGDAIIHHAAKRIGQGGLVEIWPTELPEDKVDHDAWKPLEETARTSPVARLATRIASTIREWLDTGEMLTSQGRPIRAGDILILVRKREPFASSIVSALKDLSVPVAGADRIVLTNQIAVQDLLALGDFLTLPEDDLSLAAILKSPLFGLDDDHLLTLAHDRKGTLWKSLLDHATSNPAFDYAAGQLKRWRKEADFLPPFEFYSSVLDHDGGRLKMLQRLGPEAADSIDEFLNLALTFDDQAPPSLTGFLGWLREGKREIKRDMEQGRDEVRVLTIHGSKGLEAPIVFLPDTCATKSGRQSSGLLLLDETTRPSDIPELAVWPVKGSAHLKPIKDAKDAIKRDETRELNRLLYVALTRPRDRLYIAGFQSREKLQAGCWYQTISHALANHMTPVTLPDGRVVQRIVAEQSAPAEPAKDHATREGLAAPRPAWLTTQAPRESQPSIPVAPSRLAPYDFDDAGEPTALPPSQPPASAAATPAQSRSTPTQRDPANASPKRHEDNRFLRGTLTHALLEHLPSVPNDAWDHAVAAFLTRRASGLSHAARTSIASETLAILNHPTFAALFSPASQAEVPIVAELANPSGKGPALKLNGQIDRLVETATSVLIVDYKTNRPPPTQVADVPETYLVQLAAYKLALAAIFPGKTIRAALLWTQTPSLMEIPSTTLDRYGSRLWEFGTQRVDGVGLPT